MSATTDRLFFQAAFYLEEGLPLPVDLQAQMLAEGMNVSEIERSFDDSGFDHDYDEDEFDE